MYIHTYTDTHTCIRSFPGHTKGTEPAASKETRRLKSIATLGRSPEGRHDRSSILAWRILWAEEPGGQSVGEHRGEDARRQDWLEVTLGFIYRSCNRESSVSEQSTP